MKTDVFANRHIGITDSDLPRMLGKIGVKTIDELIDKVIPKGIRLKQPLDLPPAMTPITRFTNPTSAPAGTIASPLPLSSGMCSKIRCGTRPTPPIRPRYPKDGWKR